MSRNKIMRCLTLLCFLAAAVLCGCQTGSISQSAPDSPATAADSRLATYSTNLLHEGDVVNITFQYFSNYNSLQKIALDGQLNLDGVGQVKAAGKTQHDLQEELTALYKGLTKGDSVTIKLLTQVASVYIAGAVLRPGRVTLDRPMTPLEAVIEAGGYDPYRANLNKVTVLRIEEGRQRTFKLNLNLVLQGKDTSPFYLKPFDVINVPSKTFNF